MRYQLDPAFPAHSSPIRMLIVVRRILFVHCIPVLVPNLCPVENTPCLRR